MDQHHTAWRPCDAVQLVFIIAASAIMVGTGYWIGRTHVPPAAVELPVVTIYAGAVVCLGPYDQNLRLVEQTGPQ